MRPVLSAPYLTKSTPARPRTTSKKGRVRSVCRVLGAGDSYLRAHARPARRVACAVCCWRQHCMHAVRRRCPNDYSHRTPRAPRGSALAAYTGRLTPSGPASARAPPSTLAGWWQTRRRWQAIVHDHTRNCATVGTHTVALRRALPRPLYTNPVRLQCVYCTCVGGPGPYLYEV